MNIIDVLFEYQVLQFLVIEIFFVSFYKQVTMSL